MSANIGRPHTDANDRTETSSLIARAGPKPGNRQGTRHRYPCDAARARRRLFFERPRGATLRRRVCVHREGELKRGTVGYICRGPQPTTVGFDDRTADRESHTHAAGFGGEEGVEKLVRMLGGDPIAAIRHTYAHVSDLVLA